MNPINHWIEGRSVSTTPSRTGPVYNPATGAQTAEVAMASSDDVTLAVATARSALCHYRSAASGAGRTRSSDRTPSTDQKVSTSTRGPRS